MSNGGLWKVSNGEAMPRRSSSVIGSTTLSSPYNMVATPGGEYVLLLAGSGTAYLYDAMKDDFVTSAAVATTPIQGYCGPLAAGPKGAYYVVNGNLLNSSLTLLSTAAPSGTTRPVSAVAVVGANQFARFVQPVRASANAAVTTLPAVELADTATGHARVNMSGKQMVVDSAGTTAYLLTISGVSVVPLVSAAAPVFPGAPGTGTPPTTTVTSTLPTVAANGVVNSANYSTAIAPGSVLSIFGANLASAGQINAQIPVGLAAGKYPLVVRSMAKNAASSSQTVTVAKVARAVYTLASSYAALYHKDGKPVTSSNPASRDEPLVMYATGLGATTGGTVTTGQPAPSNPVAVSGAVKVYFGDPNLAQSEVIVDWRGLAPGFIGLYQLNLRVPGAHTKGDPLPVTVRIGGVSSLATAP